jgi:hypothetical protein
LEAGDRGRRRQVVAAQGGLAAARTGCSRTGRRGDASSAWIPRSARGGPVKAAKGSVRPEMPRWPAIARGRLTGCGCSGPNSGERKGVATRVRARGPTLHWGGAPAGSGRGWIAAERRARGRTGAPGGGARRPWGLSVGGGYGFRVRVQEGLGRLFVGWRRSH